MSEAQEDSRRPIRIFIYVVLSLYVLALIVVHGIAKQRHRREIQSVQAAAANDRRAETLLGIAVSNARRSTILANRGRFPLPNLDPAAITVGGQYLERRLSKDGKAIYWFTDRATGGEAWLEIIMPGEIQIMIARPAHQPGNLPDAPSRKSYRTVQTIYQITYMLGYMAWLVLLIGFTVDANNLNVAARERELYRLLFVAIASALLSGLGFRWLWGRSRFFYDEAGGIGESVVLVTLFVMAIVRFRTKATKSYPECPRCRYNLTGNVSGVCPECGTPVSTTPQPI